MNRGLRPALGCSYWNAVDREPTEIRLLWDERFLYIAFPCTDRDIVIDPGLKRDGGGEPDCQEAGRIADELRAL